MRLLALPGLGLRGQAWAPTLAHLPAPAQVRLLPGYGEPADRGRDLHPRALALDVLGELAQDGPAVVLGHAASWRVGPARAATSSRCRSVVTWCR